MRSRRAEREQVMFGRPSLANLLNAKVNAIKPHRPKRTLEPASDSSDLPEIISSDIEDPNDESDTLNDPDMASSSSSTPKNNKRKRDEDDTANEPWSKIITVLVGKNERSFQVHENILRKVPFFDACLNAAMRERQERTIRLAEDKPYAFSAVVHFLYTGKLESPLADRNKKTVNTGSDARIGSATARQQALHLYIAAQKLMLGGLQECVRKDIETYFKYGNREFQTWEIALIDDNVEDADALRLFALERVAKYMRGFREWNEKKIRLNYKEGRYAGVAHFIIEAMVRFPASDYERSTEL